MCGILIKSHFNRGEQGRGQCCNMVRGSLGIFRQIDFYLPREASMKKKCSQMSFESLPPKDVTIKL